MTFTENTVRVSFIFDSNVYEALKDETLTEINDFNGSSLIVISKLGHSKSDQALVRIRVYHLEAKGSQEHYSMFILDMLIQCY